MEFSCLDEHNGQQIRLSESSTFQKIIELILTLQKQGPIYVLRGMAPTCITQRQIDSSKF